MYICNKFLNHECVLIMYKGERNPALVCFYYGHFCYPVCHIWSKKTLSSAVPILKEEDWPSVCETMAIETGYSGLSCLINSTQIKPHTSEYCETPST